MKENEIFRFEVGSFFGGEVMYVINDMIFFRHAYNFGTSDIDDLEFNIDEKAIKMIEKALDPVKKWEKEYYSNKEIFDGHGYSIKYNYKGTKIESYGYEAYPQNYDQVIEKIKECMENICILYDSENFIEEDAKFLRSL